MNGWHQFPGDWVSQGLCGQVDPELFYPGQRDCGNEAKRLCRSCPVQTQCLTWALDHNETHGIWGGYSPQQRKTMRRRHTGSGKADIPDPPPGEDWHGTPWGIKRHYRNNTTVCRDCRESYNSYSRHRKQTRQMTGT